jgi:hypothetical protein
MTKKMFLDRERAIPTTKVPPVSTGRTESEAGTSDRSAPLLGIADELPFMILDETTKFSPKLNATGLSLLFKFNSLCEEQEPTSYLAECIAELTNYLFDEVPGRNMVGLTIHNKGNVENKSGRD